MNYTTEQIVQAVEMHPERWQQVTRESVLSLPVPIKHAGQMWLAFFWYPVGGPIQNRFVAVPTCRVLASILSLDTIFFTHVQPQELGLSVPVGTRLGKPTIGGSVPTAELKSARQHLYILTDAILACYDKPAFSLSDSEKQVVFDWRAQMQRLAIVALSPAYTALSPDFFQWVDSVNA